MTPEEIKLDALTKFDFRVFLRRCFYTLNPDTELQWNWHLDYLCWLAMRCAPVGINPTPDEPIKRLLVNIPPRTLKSETFSVALSCFLQGHFPAYVTRAASYSGKLSTELHLKATKVMQSDWYRRIFPNTILVREQSSLFETSRGGGRWATSTGGSIMGLGADMLVADDILSVAEANSQTSREQANEWYDTAFSTRLNNRKTGVIIVVMQRLHQMDLTGHLLQKDTEMAWTHVCLPAVFEKEETFTYYGETRTFREGDLLQPNRLDEKVLAETKASLGSLAYAGQYQQRPVPKEGAIININDFVPVTLNDIPDMTLPRTRIVQVWDTAHKTGVQNDYSVCLTWLWTPAMSYLLDVMRDKLEFAQLKAAVKAQAARWNPHVIRIEDKGSGQSLLQDLRRETQLPLVATLPKGTKEERMEAGTPLIEAGNVAVRTDAPWYTTFIEECMYFPNGANDDQVDALSDYLKWVREAKQEGLRIRVL